MNTKLLSAVPPLFSPKHAESIAHAALDYPDANGVLVLIPSSRVLVAASTVSGVIERWVVESPVEDEEIEERRSQLQRAGYRYVCLSMRTDKLVPLDAVTTH